MTMVSGIIIGVVATVIGGLILRWIVGWLAARHSSRVTATYAEIVVPAYDVDAKDWAHRAEIGQFVDPNLPEPMKVMIKRVFGSTGYRVIVIALRNRGGVRSGDVEITAGRFALWHIKEYALAPSDKTIRVGKLDPNAELVVTVIGFGGFPGIRDETNLFSSLPSIELWVCSDKVTPRTR